MAIYVNGKRSEFLTVREAKAHLAKQKPPAPKAAPKTTPKAEK